MAKAKNDATRQKILSAAYKRFIDNGFENVTLKDIASDCGISLSLLQHYYRKKEMILTHITYDIIYKVLTFYKTRVALTLPGDEYSPHLADTIFYDLFYSLLRADNFRLLKVYRWVLNNATLLSEGTVLCKDFLGELYGVSKEDEYEIPFGTYIFNGTLSQLMALYFVKDTLTTPLDNILKLARTVYFRYYKFSDKIQRQIFAQTDAIVTSELKQELYDYYYQNRDHFVDMK